MGKGLALLENGREVCVAGRRERAQEERGGQWLCHTGLGLRSWPFSREQRATTVGREHLERAEAELQGCGIPSS